MCAINKARWRRRLEGKKKRVKKTFTYYVMAARRVIPSNYVTLQQLREERMRETSLRAKKECLIMDETDALMKNKADFEFRRMQTKKMERRSESCLHSREVSKEWRMKGDMDGLMKNKADFDSRTRRENNEDEYCGSSKKGKFKKNMKRRGHGSVESISETVPLFMQLEAKISALNLKGDDGRTPSYIANRGSGVTYGGHADQNYKGDVRRSSTVEDQRCSVHTGRAARGMMWVKKGD